MFVFTLIATLISLAIAIGFGVWGYLAFKSDDGSATSFIGSILGMVFGVIALLFGIFGAIGAVVLANRMWQ